MPKISVITPCFNAAPFLLQTMQGVSGQDYTEWEHIIVDDGSTDSSLSIARGGADRDPRIRVFTQPNRGPASARNLGASLAAADSRYLWFLDADDVLEPDALSTLSGYLDEHPEVGLVYGTFSIIDSDGATIYPPETSEWWPKRYVPAHLGIRELDRRAADTPLPTLVSCHQALPSVALMRRSVLARTQGWDETLRAGSEDQDMVLQMALLSCVHFVPCAVTRYRRHASNISNHHMYRGIKQFHRKWWYDSKLPRDQRMRVRRAIRFDYRLAGSLQAYAAVRQLKQGAWSQALQHLSSAMKKLVAYLLLSAGIAGPVFQTPRAERDPS